MCLYTTSPVAKIAKKDIKVYKVMRVVKSSKGEVPGIDEPVTYGVPPYFSGYIYVKGLNKPRTEGKPAKEAGFTTFRRKYYCVEEGYLHAFVDWFRAAQRVTCMKYENPEDFYYDIVEMYIPAGTAYYEGDNGDIAASALYWPEEENTKNE